jgi:cytochrome c553
MKSRFYFVKLFFVSSAIALLTIIFVGCSKSIVTTNADSFYTPTAADATATVTLADLQAGRALYINSCGRCHNLYPITNVSSSVIPGMASKAGLSATQTSQVTKYISLRK